MSNTVEGWAVSYQDHEIAQTEWRLRELYLSLNWDTPKWARKFIANGSGRGIRQQQEDNLQQHLKANLGG